MANSIESAEQNTFELADAGMTCLTEKFGAAGAEAFIAPIRREKQGCCKVEPHSFISHPQIVLFSLFFQSRRNVNRDWLFFLQSKALGIATSM